MFCSHCNTTRPANQAPCPICGAPSPLLGNAHIDNFSSVGPVSAQRNGSTSTHSQQKGQANPQQDRYGSAPQLDFNQPAWTPVQTLPQAMKQPSLLPISHQGHSANNQQASNMQLVPFAAPGTALPALPESDSVHIPPMYTKHRSIIPRHRIVSGLLSVIIVMGLLCAGTAWYARSSGYFDFISRMYGLSRPPNIEPTNKKTLSGELKPDEHNGPGAKIVSSAATTSKIDLKTHKPVLPERAFKVGQEFYVTYSMTPDKEGQLKIIFFMNDLPFDTKISEKIKPDKGSIYDGSTSITYSNPSMGKIEIYWNDKLAHRLYFKVEN